MQSESVCTILQVPNGVVAQSCCTKVMAKSLFVKSERQMLGQMAALLHFVTLLLHLTVAIKSTAAQHTTSSPLVEGLVRINGKEYAAVCNCKAGAGAETLVPESTPICNPSKVKIHTDHATSEGLGLREIRSEYGQPIDLTFGQIADYPFACMDDRVSTPVLSTPGGDLGEFLLGLAVYSGESKTRKMLTEGEITSFLNQYLAQLSEGRKFYHCTDDAALTHMEKALDIEGLDIAEPPNDKQGEIKESFKEPENIGDMHLRAMLRNPNWYHVDSGLVSATIAAFFSILWDKTNPNRDKLFLDVLAGKHHSGAVLEVTTSDQCDKAGIAPLLKPRMKGSGALITHLNSVNHRRREIAGFFTKTVSSSESIPTDQFISRMYRYGFLWLGTTSARIGKNVPFYRLTFV